MSDGTIRVQVYLPLLLLADLTLLALNALFGPCCVPSINAIKNVAYAYASWTVIVSLYMTFWPVRPILLSDTRKSSSDK